MTAIRLTANKPNGPTLPAMPSTRSAEKNNSPKAPVAAAKAGGRMGTWYSVRNKSKVPCQLETLSQPDFKNCQLTYQRAAKAKTDCRESSARARWASGLTVASSDMSFSGCGELKSNQNAEAEHSLQCLAEIGLAAGIRHGGGRLEHCRADGEGSQKGENRRGHLAYLHMIDTANHKHPACAAA